MGIELGAGIYPTMPLMFADLLVERAEAERLHSLMVPDHVMSWFAEALWSEVGNIAEVLHSPHVFFDPVPLIATWAARTEHVRFATAVTDPIRRPPAHLAVTALTLSHVTQGRFILGIGSGEAENCLPYGLPFNRPVARLEEALIIIRRLWTDGKVSYDGDFWQLRNAVCRLEPYGDKPPAIWVGAHGPRTLELTGRYADGWLPFMPMTPEHYAERLTIVRRAAEDAGRDPDTILAGYNTPVCIADGHEAAHTMLGSEAARQLALALSDDVFADLGLEHPLGLKHGVNSYVPEWLSEAELRAALAKIPDPTVAHDHIIHGTPDEVAKKLKAFEDAGMQYFAPLDTSPFADLAQMPGALNRLIELRDLLGSSGPS